MKERRGDWRVGSPSSQHQAANTIANTVNCELEHDDDDDDDDDDGGLRVIMMTIMTVLILLLTLTTEFVHDNDDVDFSASSPYLFE